MCLGVPGQITEIWRDDAAIYAHADFVGDVRRICLNYLPELDVGDHVIVHAGFALTRLDESEAIETVRVMRQVGLLPPVPAEAAS